MSHWSPTELSRDCTATTVPYGERVALTAGGLVEIVQRLGGSITVRTEMGSLMRIDGADADALGLEPLDDAGERAAAGPFEIEHVIDALQGIYDPEIPVSIVELGLVYRCEEINNADGTRRIEIDMSMTAPGCGMGDILRADALRAAQAVPGVDDVDVTLVWDPPWSVHRMSDAARLQLGML
ncbi:MAG: putative Fe-S cluster assembly protein SufT [Ilumatobacteraceae bacterium]